MAEDRGLAGGHGVGAADAAHEAPDGEAELLGIGEGVVHWTNYTASLYVPDVQQGCINRLDPRRIPRELQPLRPRLPRRRIRAEERGFRERRPAARGLHSTENRAPALAWSGLPAGARSVIITAFDADAPIPGGLWHWVVKDVPAEVGSIAAGGELPGGAVALTNDLGQAGYSGVQPPPGTGIHRLFVCATALSVERLEVPEGASLALLNILMIPHTVGRAVIVGTSDAGA
ncbi:YbhB/YbcL family Raf kinase inhibitor-like protein [Nocardia sp. NPDC050697]|uniref:YbhB/YbcL family Raf kinase inhibitor-like protein n=1 Tax=Nocardia sp. NPDC050697 TaxID=3155158 RepID=UPI0034005154